MTDDQTLLRILIEEENDAATYYDSELAREQALALDRYFGRPYGDGSEIPNRSQIVTRDIQDSVNWLLPHLLRHFTQTDDLITINDDAIDDHDPLLQDAADYLRHVFFKDNDGEGVIHDYLFDGLVQKLGVIRCAWEPADPQPPKTMEGLTFDQVLRYGNDPRYRIIAAQQDGEIEAEPQPLQSAPPMALPSPAQGQPSQPGIMPPQPGQAPGLMGMPQEPMAPMAMGPEPTFSLQVQKIAHGKVRVEAFAPEEFRISRRAKSIEEAPYHGGRFELYLADVIREHPDKAYDLDPNGAGLADEVQGVDQFGDERVTARFPEELDNGVSATNTDEERKKVVVLIEYIRGDFDRDGVVELRRIKRCGKVILENDAVDESEFTMWSPIRVSHRAIGLSLADTLMDIQKVRTVLTRRAMDSLGQSLMPRVAINRQAYASDPTLLDRLLDHDVGDVIPMDGDPKAMMMPLVTPDVSPQAFQAIEYWDRRSEEASGVNRHAMGIQPQAITDTAKGIETLSAAANSRVEQYARWAAHGLEIALNKVMRLLIKHQDQARVVKINGRRLKVDPSRWSDEMTATVHVGLAAESREKKMAYLGTILAKQEQILTTAGPGNPLVTLKHYRHTLARLVQAMGEKSATPYFGEVPENWQPPEPGPDPKTVEAQEKAKLAAAELQQKGQLQAAEFQRDTELQRMKLEADEQRQAREADFRRQLEDMKLAAETQAAAQKAELERQLSEMKAANEMQIAQMRIAAETQISRERTEAEMELARWKAGQEIKVAKFQATHRAKSAAKGDRRPAPVDDGGADVRFGGQIG